MHKLEHINDGQFGNDRSWTSNTPGKGWVQIDLPARARIGRIVWGRARDGKLSDRVPTRYVIEAATEPGKWQSVGTSDDHAPSKGKEDANATNTMMTKLLPLPPGLDAIECELERIVKDSLSSFVLLENYPDA